MDRMIYTALSGARAAMDRQQVLSNNLANVNTTGFRAEMASFTAKEVKGDGLQTRSHGLEVTLGYNDTAGPVQTTGRALDVAAQGKAMFAIQGLDGTEAYTRAGSLNVAADGTLVGHMGLPMLSSNNAPIVVPANAQLQFGNDGTLSATVAGQPPQVLGRLKLVTPDADNRVARGDDGLFRSTVGDNLPTDPNARLIDGALEGSNVNPVEAMVGMIATARQFEINLRMLQNAEKNDQSASRLLNLNN